jgi:hypothetical protein
MLDSARAYLRAHGYPSHVVEGGLEYLLRGWESVARSVARGEVQYQDDYLNDVDGRHIIFEMMPDLSPDQRAEAEDRVGAADSMLRLNLIPTNECLWGLENDVRHGYSRAVHWWYYHRPRLVDESWRNF